MLTPLERRQLVLDAGSLPLVHPGSKVIESARTVIKQKFESIASFLSHRVEAAPERKTSSAPIVALIKPVGDRCNLRCKYCFNKGPSPALQMSNRALETIIAQVLDFNPGAAEFIFHGGEPLLAGIAFFENAILFQERHRRPSQAVKNSVMTNGTLLDEQWGKFFSEHRFSVGVSIDGPPAAHDRNRVDASSSGTIQRVLRGISSAQAYGLDVGSISVIPPEPAVTAEELFEFMTSLEIRHWRVNPCRWGEPANRYPQYVESLFEVWSNSRKEIHIAIIEETLQGLLGYAPDTCWMKGICRSFIGFEPDGVVSPCCEMSLGPSFHFGNILKDSLRSILQGRAAEAFWGDRDEGIRTYCSRCNWVHLCGGGCTYHRLQHAGSPRSKDYLCETYQDVFRRLAERIDSVLLKTRSSADRPTNGSRSSGSDFSRLPPNSSHI